jgi:hypothetical protein
MTTSFITFFSVRLAKKIISAVGVRRPAFQIRIALTATNQVSFRIFPLQKKKLIEVRK